MRKDVFSFILFLSGFLASRQIGQLKLEADIAKDDARTNHQLTFKCRWSDDIYASRRNYLGQGGVKLCRNSHRTQNPFGAHDTWTIERNLLIEAGASPYSNPPLLHSTQRRRIREIIPTGEGDAKLILMGGEEIPASRGYRENLE